MWLAHAGPAAQPLSRVIALFRIPPKKRGSDGQHHAERDEYTDLLDLAHDAIFVRDFQTRAIRYWNRGAQRLYGWSSAEAHGQVADQLLATRFPQSPPSIESALDSDGEWHGELVHTGRDGSRIVVSSRWALRRNENGRPAAILEVNTDITDRKAAEEMLREQAALLDLVPDAVLVRDFDSARIEHWNRGAEVLYGWSQVEVVGKVSFELLRTRLPLDMDAVQAELIDSGQWEGELEQVARDGRQLIVASRWALRRGDDGQPRDVLVISTDITERKRAERALSRLAAAESALQERDHLLATVSHDLKTPLTAIRGQADLLLRHIDSTGTLDVDRARKGLELLRTAATRMATWIDDLLETARLDAGRSVELHREPMDLVALAWQVVAEHQRDAQRHRLRVHTRESGLVGVWDPVRLRRVLDNLVSNAIKYSPDGGEIVVSVDLGEAESGPEVCLAVADHGVGIPASDMPHIFERFRRARNVVGRIGGTGIGLHGACQIVQDHGGRIDVESREGRGTTFTVHLPLASTLQGLPSTRISAN